MSQDALNEQLRELQASLQASNELSPQTTELLQQLEAQIQVTLDPHDDTETSLADTAAMLESRFASEHPVAESLMRDIIETLAKMGI